MRGRGRSSKQTDVSNNRTNNNELSYKIQISSSPKRLETKSFNFKGLSPISAEKDNNVYVYYYGNTSKHREALELLNKAKKKGYKDAYIVAFYQKKRITVERAKQIEK